MNSMIKIALVGTCILSLGALTACQSGHSVKENDPARMMHDHHSQHERKMTAEQREQFKQAHHERKQVFEQIQKACDGKAAGTTVQIQAGDKTLDGTCSMTFKPEHKVGQKMRGEQRSMKDEHRAMRGEMSHAMHMQHDEPLTDARRAELTQQFDQRLAIQQAIAKACQGQTHGKAIQIKVGVQTIAGQCEIRFQSKAPVVPSPAPVKSVL